MPPARTILAALDFSAGAEAALVRAVTLAARTDASLHLVHAVAAPPDDPAADAVIRVRMERYIAGALGLPRAGFDPLGELDPVLAVAHGPTIPAAILRHATKIGADLLVVGTHGRSGLDRLLMGSVAEACVTASPCPVLTVPQGAETHEPSATVPVLVAVDFSDLSRAALAAGRDLADLHGAEVELVHVVRDAGPFTGLVPSALDLDAVDTERSEAVRQRLARFAEGAATGEIHVALGHPSRMIAVLAEARGAGAVVMGTHGRAGVAHAILGSTAASTIQRTSCPVLTVRGSRRPAPAGRRFTRRTAVAA